ncbi:MAG: DUF6273 domain-containing protein [Clostridiales bacterium]|jgi:hypothetical protein|nr:DUF6273 domain-containing protein [Clostridiales bacterium]
MVVEHDKRVMDELARIRKEQDAFRARMADAAAKLDIVWERLSPAPCKYENHANYANHSTRANCATEDAGIWPGDTVMFGDFHGKRLQWKVLSVQKESALIITEECLEAKPYAMAGQNCGWVSSRMREWLNTDFLKHLDDCVIPATIANKPLSPEELEAPLEEEPETIDKVFLLSAEEAWEHFSADESRIACLRGVPSWWWLRTRGALENTQAFVLDCGKVVSLGALSTSGLCCPRPACWIPLAAAQA